MKVSTVVTGLAALTAPVLAQRPSNTSVCDYYTTALLKTNNATTQYTLVTLLVNTAVIGNYTQPNVGVKVPGILAAGTYNGTAVNLLPYFNGGLASSNRNGQAVAVNFLDGGGAAPLMKNMAANDNTSNQYKLLTHLYQYIGALLGCSAMDYPAYMGQASQYSVHRYMALNEYQMGYFIQQVGLSAASFGVATADIQAAATALNTLFNVRCAAPTTVIPAQGAQLQSMCVASSCPLAPNNTCSAYAPVMQPAVANATLAGNPSSTGTTSSSSAVSTFKGDGNKASMGMGAGLLAMAAYLM